MEPFGVATGVLQVASTGFLLAKTLSEYARNVKDARSDLSNIANEVEVTSKVLQNFGVLLSDETTKAVCSPQLHADAQDALDGCEAAFNDLDNVFKSFCKPGESVKSSPIARWKWPLNKSKTKAHQERLERLKSSLSLMLNMVEFARNSSLKYKTTYQVSFEA